MLRSSLAQYKRGLKVLNLEKNIPKRKTLRMIGKQDQRRIEGKGTKFQFHGIPVSDQKFERSRQRFEKELADHTQSAVACKL